MPALVAGIHVLLSGARRQRKSLIGIEGVIYNDNITSVMAVRLGEKVAKERLSDERLGMAARASARMESLALIHQRMWE